MSAVLDEEQMGDLFGAEQVMEVQSGHAKAIIVLVSADEGKGETVQIVGAFTVGNEIRIGIPAVTESTEEGHGTGEKVRMTEGDAERSLSAHGTAGGQAPSAVLNGPVVPVDIGDELLCHHLFPLIPPPAVGMGFRDDDNHLIQCTGGDA